MYCEPGNFLSGNRHFHKSALARYTQWDFIDLVSRHGIAWHEKTLGQLFCDGKATRIVEMLRAELVRAGADLWLQTSLVELSHRDGVFHAVTETRPALVPLTFSDQRFAPISGGSLPITAGNARTRFDEALLFTHRGLSGPAILQISSYWREGEEITLDLLPGASLAEHLKQRRGQQGKRSLTTELGDLLPARLVPVLAQEFDLSGNLADLSDKRIALLDAGLKVWSVKPSRSEGYRTAEVTLGGVDTDAVSSSSIMSKTVQGLYFIGEYLDVTGWLGGFNFQWAWSSGVAAGSHIAATKQGALD